MDKAAIIQAAKAARTFTIEVGDGRSITLEHPSPHQMRIAYLRGGAVGDDPAFWPIVLRSLLEQTVIGWSKVKVDDLLGDGNKEAAVFDAALVPVMLDAQDKWRSTLEDAVSKRVAEKATKIEELQKN